MMSKYSGALFLLLFLFFYGCSSFSQVVFPKEYQSQYLPFSYVERFKPNADDIALVERIVKSQLKGLNNELQNQGGLCPIVHRELGKYDRQYFGYVVDSGERMIWVNFIWSGGVSDEYLNNDVVATFDGCSYYWNVKVNMTEERLFDLGVNSTS